MKKLASLTLTVITAIAMSFGLIACSAVVPDSAGTPAPTVMPSPPPPTPSPTPTAPVIGQPDFVDENDSLEGIDVEPNYNITWEEAAGESKGVFQVDDLGGGTNVTLLYNIDTYHSSRITDEDFKDTVSILKKRMDAIGVDYVIGYFGIDNRGIAVKTSPINMGISIANLIGRNGGIRLAYPFDILFYEFDELSLLVNETQNSVYTIDIPLKDVVDYKEILQYVHDETIYLVVNGIVIAGTKKTELRSDGNLRFSSFDFVSHPEMNDESKFILDLLSEVANGEQMTYAYDGDPEDKVTFDLELADIIWEDGGDSPAYKWGVNTSSVDDLRICNIIAEQFSNVSVSQPQNSEEGQIIILDLEINDELPLRGLIVRRPLDSAWELDIILDLEINDEFPLRFEEIIEDIYTACGFDESRYSRVYFYSVNDDEINFSFSYQREHNRWEEN